MADHIRSHAGHLVFDLGGKKPGVYTAQHEKNNQAKNGKLLAGREA